MISDFFSAYNQIVASLEGKSIVANAETLSLPTDFFNVQPAFRNPDTCKYPGIVIKVAPPVIGSLEVYEKFRVIIEVTAAPSYLEGVKAPTIVIQDGDTIEFMRKFQGVSELETEVLTATFSSGDFADAPNATPAEIQAVLAAQFTGVVVTVEPEDIVRVTHSVAASTASLAVSGGTATNLIDSFPTYTVCGRDAGEEIQLRDPPAFYDFVFEIITKADRFDHHASLLLLVEKLYRVQGVPKQKALEIDGESYLVTKGIPVDDPLIAEGLFICTHPFTLRSVPVLLDEDFYTGDNFNGGNFDGSGTQPRDQAPLGVTFEINVEVVGHNEPLISP